MQMAIRHSDRHPAVPVTEEGDVRRLRLLYGLMTRLQKAHSREEVYAAAAESLAGDARHIPFAVLYAAGEDGAGAGLVGVSGIARGHALAPEMISPQVPHPWPVADVMRSGAPRTVGPLTDLFPDLSGPWRRAPVEALLLPVSAQADAAARGALVLGVGPASSRGAGFSGFAQEIARRIALSLLAVEAMEIDRLRASAVEVLALEVEHRRRIERQQNLLLDELNHRVKNTLATVQAIAIQTLKGADIPARDSFIARLFALSSQHDLLTLGNWEGASLEGVVQRALRPYREEGRERLLIEGPAVHLSPKRALALGMAFHELATNAARHGALSGPDGQLQVRWTLHARGKRLRLVWRETGGPRIALPGPKGFGLRLVEQGLAREISGAVQIAFSPGGLVCSWEMTLS